MVRIMENGRPAEIRRLEELIKHSENMAKQSEKLNCWTKVIAFTTIALILFAIAQIVLVILLRQ